MAKWFFSILPITILTNDMLLGGTSLQAARWPGDGRISVGWNGEE